MLLSMYLVGKQRSRGSETTYLDLLMSEYLVPTNSDLSIEENQHLFELSHHHQLS